MSMLTKEDSTRIFAPIEKTISILIVDDDPFLLETFKEIISEHPLCIAKTADSSKAAKRAFSSDSPIHMCFLDLGLTDINNDEYYILRQYARKVPIIIISGATNIKRSFIASQLGAVDLFTKPVKLWELLFWNRLCTLFLEYRILPGLTIQPNTMLSHCCRVLHEENPKSVNEWAAKANITPKYLRILWKECCGHQPKHVLFMYELYKNAFEYYNTILQEEATKCVIPIQRKQTILEYTNQMTYYTKNKQVLSTILTNT